MAEGYKKKWTFITEDKKMKAEWLSILSENSKPLGGAGYRFGSSLPVREECEARYAKRTTCHVYTQERATEDYKLRQSEQTIRLTRPTNQQKRKTKH